MATYAGIDNWAPLSSWSDGTLVTNFNGAWYFVPGKNLLRQFTNDVTPPADAVRVPEKAIIKNNVISAYPISARGVTTVAKRIVWDPKSTAKFDTNNTPIPFHTSYTDPNTGKVVTYQGPTQAAADALAAKAKVEANAKKPTSTTTSTVPATKTTTSTATATTTTSGTTLTSQYSNVANSMGYTLPDGTPITGTYSGNNPTSTELLNAVYAMGLTGKGGSVAKGKQLVIDFLKPYGIDGSYFFQVNSKDHANVLKNVTALMGAANQFGGQFGKVDPKTYDFSASGLSEAQKLQLQTLQIEGQQFQAYANATATASAKINADSNLKQTLDQWGLSKLQPLIDDAVFKKNITNAKELMDLIRTTKEYKDSFQGLVEHNKTAAQQMTEAQYLAASQSMMNTAQAAGLPDAFFTQAEIGKLIGGQVSPAEFSRRIAEGYNAVAALPQGIQNQFMQQHGIGPGGLLAYFLDPTKAEPVIARQALSANLQNTAQSAGLQDFSSSQAKQLAEMVRVAGTTGAASDPYSQFTLGKAQTALQTASKDVNLTKALPGATAPTVDTNTLIGSQIAGFGGTTQPVAQRQVQLAEEAKAAPFEKGGGYSETAKGVTGLGSART